jgi:hypothetical protein
MASRDGVDVHHQVQQRLHLCAEGILDARVFHPRFTTSWKKTTKHEIHEN